jgi:hypothetical protein
MSSGGASGKDECVRVVVRCRPLSSKEKADGREVITELDESRGVYRVYRPGARSGAGAEPPKECVVVVPSHIH